MLLPTLATLLSTAALLAAAPGPGGLLINPVQVFLSPAAPTAVLTLRNQGTEPARFQLTVFKWQQSPDTGEPLLTPTDDVLVSPPLLILAAGEERKIRIATTTTFGAVEQTYRLRLEQLQPPKNPDEGQQLRMLTTFSLPIFLSPPKPAPQSHLTAIGMGGRRWSLALNNTGNVHMQVAAISVQAIGDTGDTVFERQLEGSYVLPGMTRVFEMGEVPPECVRVRRLRVDVKTRRGASTDGLEVGQPVCAR